MQVRRFTIREIILLYCRVQVWIGWGWTRCVHKQNMPTRGYSSFRKGCHTHLRGSELLGLLDSTMKPWRLAKDEICRKSMNMNQFGSRILEKHALWMSGKIANDCHRQQKTCHVLDIIKSTAGAASLGRLREPPTWSRPWWSPSLVNGYRRSTGTGYIHIQFQLYPKLAIIHIQITNGVAEILELGSEKELCTLLTSKPLNDPISIFHAAKRS